MNENHSKLLLFLLAAENNDPTMRFGVYTIHEAINSLASILETTPDKLQKLLTEKDTLCID